MSRQIYEDSIQLRQTADAGIGLFTPSSIPAGELIFQVNAPFASVLDTPHLKDACARCFVWVPEEQGTDSSSTIDAEQSTVKLKACTGCKIVKYCSKVCGF